MSSIDLTARVAQSLESGELRAIDVERMLDGSRRRGRFRLPSLFAAVGLLTVVSGLAFLYIAGYHALTLTERRFTPFAFPAMLVGAAVLLDRFGRPRWQVELAAMVADLATRWPSSAPPGRGAAVTATAPTPAPSRSCCRLFSTCGCGWPG